MILAIGAVPAFAAAGADAAAPPPGEYLARLAARRVTIISLRGAATLTLYGEKAGTFAVAVAFVPPGRARLEVSGPLGGAALIVTAAGGELLADDAASQGGFDSGQDVETVQVDCASGQFFARQLGLLTALHRIIGTRAPHDRDPLSFGQLEPIAHQLQRRSAGHGVR